MERVLLFNSDVEVGIRILAIIESCNPTALSLDKIMYLDYLLLYGVKNEKGETLHPSYKLQILELTEHRDRIKNSILYLIKKDLISVLFNKNGIFYKANANSLWYIQNMDSPYSIRLIKYAETIAKVYKALTVEQLNKIVKENL